VIIFFFNQLIPYYIVNHFGVTKLMVKNNVSFEYSRHNQFPESTFRVCFSLQRQYRLTLITTNKLKRFVYGKRKYEKVNLEL